MLTNDEDLLSSSHLNESSLFIHAGTSGVRHLFPIHVTDIDYTDELFCRSISYLRSRIRANELSTTVDTIRNACSSIQTLEHLDVSKNDLDQLPSEICSLIHLQTLNCSQNRLSNISDLCDQLKQLKELDLSFNQFKHLPHVVYKFKHLSRLNCDHNFIKKLHIEFSNLKYLKTLVLDHNQIQTLDGIDFALIKRLEYIHIAHNQLMKFPFNLHRLTHLKNVNLSHNCLTYFPIELLLINRLDVLNLSHNRFSQLPPLPDVYKRTSHIFSIDLSHNQLTKLYDYLVMISFKVDLSNNRIQYISKESLKNLTYDFIKRRELLIHNNPIKEPALLSEILNEDNTNPKNVLELIRYCFQEEQNNEIIRQGFKIFITGCKQSGKSSLAYCLEGYFPSEQLQREENVLNILQFPFRCETNNDQLDIETKSVSSSSKKSIGLPKIKSNSIDAFARKGKARSNSPASQSSTSSEITRSVPVAIFDFNGSLEYYEHTTFFIDSSGLHLICIHANDFDVNTPSNMEAAFSETFDLTSCPIVKQLFFILQVLCEKVTRTDAVLILPIVTCIDLYDGKSQENKAQCLERVNRFFELYTQHRISRLKNQIEQISSLPIIPPSLSDRLKTYTSILNINVQIESCLAVSSLTYQGISELNQTIQRHFITQNSLFPHINRILPTLWADANRYVESLTNYLPIPCAAWDTFSERIVTKYGFSNIIEDIALSLSDQGKILVLNEIGTTNRMVFLRPLWLADVLSSLFNHDRAVDPTYHSYMKEYKEHGRLHVDFASSLWIHVLHKKEYLYHAWSILMKFLLIGYPKLSKKTVKTALSSEEKSQTKYDYIIIPHYLPLLDQHELEQERKRFHKQITHKVNVCYQSSMLPMGLFHRYSVLTLLRLDVVYVKHWKNFIIGEHKEKQVKFIFETNHHSYVNIICGTDTVEKAFDNIWFVLMSMLNHFEQLLKALAPNNQFNRFVCCPNCDQYSFMGEWTTPKELQGVKIKVCSLCGKHVDTSYLIQPNENKRRNEELLKKIRERKANNNMKKNTNITSATLANTTL